MYKLDPHFHIPKNKKSLKNADVWPADVIINGKHKWVMTSEGVPVKYKGYVGIYSSETIENNI
jgi:hypothetical protein